MKDPGEILVMGLIPFLEVCLGYNTPVVLGLQIFVIPGMDENSVEGIPCFKTDADGIFVQVTGFNELLYLVVCHAVLLIFLQSTTFGPKAGDLARLFTDIDAFLQNHSHA